MRAYGEPLRGVPDWAMESSAATSAERSFSAEEDAFGASQSAQAAPRLTSTKVSLEEDVVGGPTTDDDGATTSTGASAKEGAPLRPAACSTTTMLLFDRSERERALYAPCVPPAGLLT